MLKIKQMVTVSNIIEQLISNTPFLEEYIYKGLINVSSLARELQPKVQQKLGKPIKEAAITMSINRMNISPSQLQSKKIKSILKQITDISVRSSLMDYTFKNTPDLRTCISKLIKEIEHNHEVFFTLSQGIYESTIIINKSLSNKINAIFKNETCVHLEDNITAINIKLPAINTKIKGIYYMIFRYFVNNNINIKDVVSTSNELTILIDSSDAERAFSTINKIKLD